MLNKLYHKRKVKLNQKGVNKIVSVGGVDQSKTITDILNSSINQRTKLNLKTRDIFFYKYLRCNLYKMFKGPKFYMGKIIYEGEQRLKNEADIGNVV